MLFAPLFCSALAVLCLTLTPSSVHAQRSHDWELIEHSLDVAYYMSHRENKNIAASADERHIVVTTGSGISESLWHSGDSGATWQGIRYDRYPIEYHDLAYPAPNALYVFADSIAWVVD